MITISINANANGDPNKTCQNRRCNGNGFASHLTKDCRNGGHGSNANSGSFTNLKRKAYQKDPEGSKTWKKMKEKVYNALAKDPQISHKELEASYDLIEELALFSATNANGAKKRFVARLRKPLHPRINNNNINYDKYNKSHAGK